MRTFLIILGIYIAMTFVAGIWWPIWIPYAIGRAAYEVIAKALKKLFAWLD